MESYNVSKLLYQRIDKVAGKLFFSKSITINDYTGREHTRMQMTKLFHFYLACVSYIDIVVAQRHIHNLFTIMMIKIQCLFH